MTRSRIMMLGFVAAFALALTAFAPAERVNRPIASPQPTAVDTLRFEVAAGDPLLVSLPGRVDGLEVTYEVVEAPALSWLVDRSFYYQTMRGERGTLAIEFERRTEDGATGSVILLVTITA